MEPNQTTHYRRHMEYGGKVMFLLCVSVHRGVGQKANNGNYHVNKILFMTSYHAFVSSGGIFLNITFQSETGSCGTDIMVECVSSSSPLCSLTCSGTRSTSCGRTLKRPAWKRTAVTARSSATGAVCLSTGRLDGTACRSAVHTNSCTGSIAHRSTGNACGAVCTVCASRHT